MTNKQRMLMAMRGEMPDVIPFAPRLDLWFTANKALGTLPKAYQDCTHHSEVALAEGWGLHQINPAYQEIRKPEDNLHWALGVLTYKETVFGYRFGGNVDIVVDRQPQGRTQITYHTPKGTVSTTTVYTEEMRRSGSSASMIEEFVLKGPQDYAAVAYIFENLELYPDWDDFVALQNKVGDHGVAFSMAGRAASPMHHIQKYFVDATDFFYHYKDYAKQMESLAESLSTFFQQTIDILAQSPAEAVYWGANFDDMITYPEYFAKDISPWIGKAAGTLGAKNIIVSCHCDGENRGLMDLIRDSGMHVAESVCPHPMTKVTLAEYYQRWSDYLVIFGGVPSNLLLKQTTSDQDFADYLDMMFKAVAPGRRMIFGIADSTPPGADFDRIRILGERIAKEGRLPIETGAFRAPVNHADKEEKNPTPEFSFDSRFAQIQKDVLRGDQESITRRVQELLDQGVEPGLILNRGMLPAMEMIGERFKAGDVFIPEVLLSARAMNMATEILQPHLVSDEADSRGRFLIGTVKGDLHDIGKNIVATMLKGVGFQVKDLGINVKAEDFVQAVRDFKPHVLGLSALLTTTMPQMSKVIEAVTEAGMRNSVGIMVGGAPVNQKFADDIGADAYAQDAGAAVSLAKSLMAR